MKTETNNFDQKEVAFFFFPGMTFKMAKVKCLLYIAVQPFPQYDF